MTRLGDADRRKRENIQQLERYAAKNPSPPRRRPVRPRTFDLPDPELRDACPICGAQGCSVYHPAFRPEHRSPA